MPANSLVLVDGSYYLFRAYHGMPALSNAEGEPTGAIYGVINMLRKLQKEFIPDYFAVVFDAKGKSFRNDLYPEYKANRPPMPDDLRCQIEPVHRIIRALGIPLLIMDNVEADDVIGTLAINAEAEGLDVTISTGDKDLAQLVNENIRLLNTMSDVVLDREGVISKFGVPPERIIDYLALVGDSVDNVPGVPKVGPKTAAKWLNQFGSLDGVIENASDIGGKVGESLRENIDKVPLSKELVTLKLDLELDISPSDLICEEPDQDILVEEFGRWQLRSWLADFTHNSESGKDSVLKQNDEKTNSPEAKKEVAEIKYDTIHNEADFLSWLNKLESAKLIAFDTETTSLDYMQAEIVGVSFAVTAGEAAYVPLAHDYPGAPEQLNRDYVLEKLKPLLESAEHAKLGQNLKYDMSVLANYGITLKGIAHDTMLESYVLDSTASRHDMDSLAKKHLGIETIHFEDIAGKGKKQLTFNEVSVDVAAPYAAEDADVTLRLHQSLWPKFETKPDLVQLYENIELPLLSVLSRIERTGVMIDADKLLQQSAELSKEMARLETQAHDMAGQSFNIGSPKQIQTILYEKMELPVLAKTPKGQPSTAESVLQELAADYELPQLILDYRSLSKLKSTYTDKLPLQIDPDSGRVHTSYHQAVASTGRLSSSDPNLQNIPIRTAEGRRIRQAFIAPQGYTLMAADYSQIELRIMAHLSGDENLLKAFKNNEDVHRFTASEVFDVNLDEVDSEQRRAAKAINFGLIYGMSAFGLANQLGIDRSSAKEYVDRYFSRYPAVKAYMDNTRLQAKEDGFVETVYKRRLYLPEINAKNAARRQYAERTAINAPMQGTAADIIKMAMIKIDNYVQTQGEDIKIVMQVHDELVFEVIDKRLEEVRQIVCKLMSEAGDLSVPLVVEAGSGHNWNEAH
ncbi:MAG: DNA polymerase I [Gammaproteobacteria bacterium]|nr:DNA polymerase I [Gammaproteobacteria bacterium]